MVSSSEDFVEGCIQIARKEREEEIFDEIDRYLGKRECLFPSSWKELKKDIQNKEKKKNEG